MKTILLFASFLMFTVLSVSAQHDQVSVTVEGLGCPFCAYGLEKRFKDLKGVSDIKIEMETGVMTFNSESHQGIDFDIINRQVDRAGYTMTDASITRANGESLKWETFKAAVDGDWHESSFKVSGNCGMCKSRIERAAVNTDGIESAVWNAETQMLLVNYNPASADLNKLHQNIADSGHDTERFTAKKAVYESLPACCLYRRN